MNFKTTINLLDVGLNRCFINFLLHFEGVLLVVSGCTWGGGSRILKIRNSPPLYSVHVTVYEETIHNICVRILVHLDLSATNPRSNFS